VPRALSVAVGTAARADADLLLTIGPQHPSSHGALRLALVLDGEHIVSADPRVGFVHRGAEKLYEVRDYRQVMMLANRHDWHAAFAGELGIALAVERMLGLEVPPRAVWLRTLFAELTRITSHLAFLGGLPGADPAAPRLAAAAREAVQALFEEATGGRVHLMYARLGGVKEDVPPGWADRAAAALGAVRGGLPALDAGVAPALPALAGLGVLPRDVVLAYGASGPVARASGLDLDLRRDEPYLAYGELAPIRVPVAERGDALARVGCLRSEIDASLDLAETCLRRMPAGPVGVRLPKVVRAPEGTVYSWTENPSGLLGCYLVSRGEPTPYRVHLRTPSFNNVALLADLLPGAKLGDLAGILASVFFVVGDVDR
jgi:NADH-quinone oxidoreductase subunit D